MNNLDQQYIAGLADLAVLGDSNAFAELYAATFQQQYRFSYDYLQDEYLARDALQETYIQVPFFGRPYLLHRRSRIYAPTASDSPLYGGPGAVHALF